MYSSMYKLVIGSKNVSSWSLRPWLLLKMLGEPFEEILIPLGRPDSKERILALSPSGKVPLLIDGQHKIWDSLAIAEALADSFPAAHLWPKDLAERTLARSVAAEMHSGFAALREHLPMNFAARGLPCSELPAVRADIARIAEIWTQLRTRYYEDGPFLFGPFSIADAMFAPVASRFTSYQVTLPPEAAAYRDHLMSLPAMQEWLAASEQELRQS